ncbi:BZ3500_MvSof-1268-A1-R1_Chr7-3g09591 [Microbotryum saponariae]|uniref:BZ3500_MvSof-1268-A1-R1_Chr7-3g09591 protein n=1 Tax=Microbotryum saponariae TaxID=289078 RepID=A0A2X0LSM2_9BASI|nr:BZ3500_MvSof-1268-A1-R1_Chr7-3g09591 [Microbotryum saponariae]
MSSSEPSGPTPYAPTATPSRSSRTRESSSATHLTRQKSSHVLLQTPARTTTTTTSSSASTSTPAGGPVTSASFSPAYQTSIRSRHSLYGIEDRIVLDLGSRIWKLGFSGEPRPRVCLDVTSLVEEEGETGNEEAGGLLWALEGYQVDETRERIRYERLKKGLRRIWYTHLMTDPKQRKIIISENPLLSTQVKHMIAKVLFENLQVSGLDLFSKVPSITFGSAPVLALLATGNVTGLVVDCGHLETTVLPVFASRPLFPSLLSTPRASSLLNARLKALLLEFASYAPPPTSFNSSTPPTIGRVPERILSEEVVEEVKNRCCFVGKRVEEQEQEEGQEEVEERERPKGSVLLFQKMEKRFAKRTKATTLSWRLPVSTAKAGRTTSTTPGTLTGQGWLLIPGWVRERAAEVIFDSGDGGEDERSLQEVILEALLKLPIDLRRPLAGSILCTGGTTMLPGFIPRLRHEIDEVLRLSQTAPLGSKPVTQGKDSATRRAYRARLDKLRTTPRYASLTPLRNHISILNDPSNSFDDTDTAEDGEGPRRLGPRSGSAPAWSASLLNWVGGSLAGCLKLGGVEEVKREGWDERQIEREKAKEASGRVEVGVQLGEEAEEEERMARGTAPLGPALGVGVVVNKVEEGSEGRPRVSQWVGLEA